MRIRWAALWGVLSSPIAFLTASLRPIHLLSAPADQRRSSGRRPPPLVTPRSPVTEALVRPPRAMSQRDVHKFSDIGNGFSNPSSASHCKLLYLGPHGGGDGRAVR